LKEDIIYWKRSVCFGYAEKVIRNRRVNGTDVDRWVFVKGGNSTVSFLNGYISEKK
jgi:hypothetical protein